MRTKIIVVSLIVVIIVVVLAIVLVPRLNKPEQTFNPTYWPTEGWQTSTPEEQGLQLGQTDRGDRTNSETKHPYQQPSGHSKWYATVGCLLL